LNAHCGRRGVAFKKSSGRQSGVEQMWSGALAPFRGQSASRQLFAIANFAIANNGEDKENVNGFNSNGPIQ
jgi:hypothetical protein